MKYFNETEIQNISAIAITLQQLNELNITDKNEIIRFVRNNLNKNVEYVNLNYLSAIGK